ncbi:hypothetical protein ES705_10241 [subsurface metagenome]
MRFKLTLSLLAFIIFFSNIFAQKPFMKFGKIPIEELEMTSYAIDTSAGAVILGDFGVTNFDISKDEGFFLTFSTHIRIKILDKDELDRADFNIILYESNSGKDEDLSGLKACTYNLENGKIVKYKLGRKDIYREKIDKNHKQVKFSLPNVKVGSVIEVEYRTVSPFVFNLNSWYFQSSIPTRRSEYHVFMPEYFYYKNWVSGYVPVRKDSETHTKTFQYTKSATIDPAGGRESGSIVSFEAQVTHWTYTAENVPAFINEPYITTVYDYLSAVEFELKSTKYPWSVVKYYTKTWKDINRELMEDSDFGKQLNNKGHLKAQIEAINNSCSDPLEKMSAAYEHIKSSMLWDKRYRIWSSGGIRKAYNEGGGSSASINLNLVALCRGLGLDANPVLVSTRQTVQKLPGIVHKPYSYL